MTDTIGATVEAIRASARKDGFYQGRRPIQAMVIGIVVLACLIALPVVLRVARNNSRLVQCALAGSLGLFGFLIVRAISLHQVDAVLNRRGGLPKFNLGDSIELVSILIIGTFILLSWKESRAAAGRPERPIRRPSGTWQ